MNQVNTIFKARVGRPLYGLATPDSDEDFCGVFMPHSSQLLGLQPINEVSQNTKDSGSDRRNTADDVDDKQYSLQKFLHLALQNNPNIIELLFVNPENTLVCSPLFQELIDNRDKIISAKVFHTFSGYAHAQKHKLVTKRERFSSLREALVDLFPTKYSEAELQDPKRKFTDTEAQQLNWVLKCYKGKDGNPQPFHEGMPVKVIHELLTHEYEEYGWRVKTKTFETLGYDVKFAYHLLRLMLEGSQLLSCGGLEFPFTGTPYEVLRDIRSGKFSFDEIMAMYDRLENVIIFDRERSSLPHEPDRTWANKWLVRVTRESIINEQ